MESVSETNKQKKEKKNSEGGKYFLTAVYVCY